jgi:acetolactate synthase-1/2/3 large subunit
LTLPRELLAGPATAARRDNVRPMGSTAPAPSLDAIEQAAKLVAEADFPLILTSATGRTRAAFDELAALAQEFALPVVQADARDLNLPTSHPMHLGFDAGAHLAKADVVLVLNSAVPWVPSAVTPKRDAKVIHVSTDPLETKYPFRAFEADMLITGAAHPTLVMLREALRTTMKSKDSGMDKRRKYAASVREEADGKRRKLLETVKDQVPVHPAWLGACVNKLKAEDAVIVNELGISLGQLDLTTYGSYLGGNLAGGLGFGLGAGLGIKLAQPDREVIVGVGDGSYMFGNPLPFHYVGRAEGLPILTIIANNHSWHAVKRATLDVYPDGAAAKANIMPLTSLNPAPDYEKVIESCGGHGEKVETPDHLIPALERSLAAVRSGTPALLNVITQGREGR